MTGRVLADTGAIYAFVTRTDAHHREAVAFVKKWIAVKGVFILSDVVFVESMTLLKARAGPKIALQVGRELRDNPAWLWSPLGPDGERETWGVFQRYQDKEWSYTDCALLVLSRKLEIEKVFAFDEHFDQMQGVIRVP